MTSRHDSSDSRTGSSQGSASSSSPDDDTRTGEDTGPAPESNPASDSTATEDRAWLPDSSRAESRFPSLTESRPPSRAELETLALDAGAVPDEDTVLFETLPANQPGSNDATLAVTPLTDEEASRTSREAVDELCRGARHGALAELAERGLLDVRRAGAALPEAKFEFLELLGQGGMGRVLLVADHDIRRTVAMKVLLPRHRRDASLVSRFLDEVQIAGQLEHPNILPIHEFGVVEGEPWFTMKQVEGETLREVLHRLREGDAETAEEYTLVRRLQIFQQVCMAMAYAHGKGVLHRDLKPDNIMIGPFGEVMVMDWGLAMVITPESPPEPPPKPVSERQRRISGRRSTTVSTTRFERASRSESRGLKGTPLYMSPEQAGGRVSSLSERSDIYTLGVILYELLCFRQPLRGKTLVETLMLVTGRMPEPPSRVARKRDIPVPPGLDELCLRALAKAPDDRPAAARELADEVQAFIDGSRERSRARSEAARHIERGHDFVRSFHELRAELEHVREALERLEQEIPAWAPLARKAELWRARERAEKLEEEGTRAFEASHDAFDAALGARPGDPRAREAKADLFWESFQEAERRGHRRAARHFRARVEAFDDGKYRMRLERAGALEIELEPWPESVFLARLEERDHVMAEIEPSREIKEGAVLRDLAPGPYVLHAWKRGHAALVLPLALRRGKPLHVRRPLLPAGRIPPGFEYVPGGDARLGGDEDAPSSLPHTEVPVEGFLMARHPVTAAAWIDFINALATVDPERARSRVPRERGTGAPLWKPEEDGSYRLESQRFEGGTWHPEWPIFGLSYRDAISYCKWVRRETGSRVRLPTEHEWEWAARGPSGFLFPWGRRFDATFCKMRQSRAGEPGPEPIGSFPADRSPFGICDLAGGVHEWCRSTFDPERGMLVLRGGAWTSTADRCRLAARLGDQPYDRHLTYGFRLARDLPRDLPGSGSIARALSRPSPEPEGARTAEESGTHKRKSRSGTIDGVRLPVSRPDSRETSAAAPQDAPESADSPDSGAPEERSGDS